MIQCNQCEFFEEDSFGNVRLHCNPFANVKEPECLAKWQLMKLEALVQAYQATLAMYRKLAPLQEKMFRYMEREIGDIDEADRWKEAYDDEDDEDDEDENKEADSFR